jgi:hypothetical protein
VWNEATPIAGTLAARYLTDARRIELAALPSNIDEALPFHPRCPFGAAPWPTEAYFRSISR